VLALFAELGYCMGMMNKQFELNQKDLTLDDTKVLWGGAFVYLQNADRTKDLASVRANANTVVKLMAWCVKNHYRCSQIVNGRVEL